MLQNRLHVFVARFTETLMYNLITKSVRDWVKIRALKHSHGSIPHNMVLVSHATTKQPIALTYVYVTRWRAPFATNPV